VDIDSRQNAGEIDLPAAPTAMVVSADGTKIYTLFANSEKIVVISARHCKVLKMVTIPAIRSDAIFIASKLFFVTDGAVQARTERLKL
jgi:hypothetical protein